MKEILSLPEVKNRIATSNDCWLLLFRKGSEQSDCAFRNFASAVEKQKDGCFFVADTNHVRDIHTEFSIASVPALIRFKEGNLVNIVKGCQTTEQYLGLVQKSIFLSQKGEKGKPTMPVIVYTTPTCSWCKTLKRHFDSKGIRYREVDVATNQKAAEEMVRKSGKQGVPQTEINGQMIVGFDQSKINSLLGIN
jgi:glutaredoxin-like YruB-family protein